MYLGLVPSRTTVSSPVEIKTFLRANTGGEPSAKGCLASLLTFRLPLVLGVAGVVLALVVCSFLAVVRPLLLTDLQHQHRLLAQIVVTRQDVVEQ